MKRILLALLALALAPIFVPSLAAPAKAQDKLVVSIWGGSWRDLIAETVAKKFTAETGVAVEFITGGTIDRLNKEKLAKGSPESDITFTTSHVGWLYANDGLFEQLDLSKIANAANLANEARISPFHLGAWAYVYTIGYRADLLANAKFESWEDLWKPEYKGKVGITNLNSTLGTGFLVEIARMHGGSEANVEPGFKAIEALKPSISAVASNPGQLATLFQQGQIDISPGNFNAIQIMKARGVAVEFVAPKEKAIAFKTTIHIVKNTGAKDLAFALIEAALSPDVQAKLMESPYLIVPTNTKVKMGGEIAKTLAKDHADMKNKFVFQDWKKINEQRSAWIERFNREIKV